MKILQYITAYLLRFIKPGYYVEPLFLEMCRLNTLISVEICCVIDGKFFLLKRSDKYFGDVWHIPGTMLRAGEDFGMAIKRLTKQELFGAKFITIKEPIYYFVNTPRGNILHKLHVVTTNDNRIIKRMIDKDNLPNEVISWHKEIIKKI